MEKQLKTIKFSSELVPLVISGEKTCTWRLWDDKDLKPGDEVVFIKRPELTPFALARLVRVTNKTMGTLDPEDYQGHEEYKEPLFKYREYYKREVTVDTPVAVVHFEIIKFI